jgi:hypothetical protein
MLGLFETELIKLCGRRRTAEQVELATLESVDWFTGSASQAAQPTCCCATTRSV